MALQKVIIKEFKKLENFEKEIAGHHVLIMGENGVGKSTVIQFIEIGLGKQTNIPPGVNGSGELQIMKDGNLLTCKVRVEDGKSILSIRGKGVSIDNKKGAIADLFGPLDFDIDEFADLSKTRAGRKEQVEIFKKFLPEETQKELAKFEADVKNKTEERTELGRDIKKLEGAIALHPLKNLIEPELKKIQPTDTTQAMADLKKIQEANAGVDKVETGIVAFRKEIEGKNIEICELEAKIKKLQSEVDGLDKKINNGKEWLKTHTKADTSVLEKTIEDSGKQNERYNQAQQLLKDQAQIEVLKNDQGELTALIESSREAIANAIREQDSPVDDLTYDDEQLIWKGIPVNPDCLSTSEIIELGIRLKMAENPDLGILFIQRAESLGAERFKLIKDIADKAGWQLICEQVERGQKELHIEIMTEELIGA